MDNDQKCFDVSKAITRLLRHDQTFHLAIQYSYVIEECRKKLDAASPWSLEEWTSTLAKGGGAKKRIQYCLNPNSSNQVLYLRAIFKDIQEKKSYWSHVARQCIITERIYRVHVPRRERERIEPNNKKWTGSSMDKPQVRKTSRVLHCSESNGAWKWFGGWWKLHAIQQNQELLHTRILVNASKILYIGAIWSSLKRKACVFTKHGHMQSFSATHNLQLTLRKRNVWKTRAISAKRFAWLQESGPVSSRQPTGGVNSTPTNTARAELHRMITLHHANTSSSRAGTWQDRSTKRVPPGLTCVEEMLQESWLPRWTFYRYSRSISQRSSLSWITTRNRMDRTKVQRVGRTCKRRPYISSHSRGKEKYQGQWCLTLNKAGKNGPMKLRSDFRAAVSMKNRLHHESGEQVEDPIHPEQYSQWHPSSSTSWWDKSEWNWKWAHKIFFNDLSFCYNWFRLQSIAIHCNRREV